MQTSERIQAQPKLADIQEGGGKKAGLGFPPGFNFSGQLGQMLAAELPQSFPGGRTQRRCQRGRIHLPEKFGPAGARGKIRPTKHLQSSPLQFQRELFQLQHPFRHRRPDFEGGNRHPPPDVPGRGDQNFRPALVRPADLHAELRLDFGSRPSQILQDGLGLPPHFGNRKFLRGRLPPRLRPHPSFQVEVKTQHLPPEPLDADFPGTELRIRLHPAGLRLHPVPQGPAHMGVP
jgi:hypothetical protein